MSGRPDPSGSDSAGEFTDALVALRVWAGKPSLRTLRDLARPAGALPTSTVHEILAGRRLPNLPRLEFVEAYVRTCLRVHGGAEPAETEAEVQRWRDAWRRLTSDRPYAIADGPPPVLARAPDPLPPVTVVTPEPLPAADPPPRTIVLAPPRRRSARMLAAAGLFLTGLLVGAVGVWFLPRDSGAPATAASGSAPPEVTCRTALPAPPDGPELISNGAFDRPLRRPWWTDSPKVELTAAGDALVAHVMGGTVNAWDAGLVHGGLGLRADTGYALVFRIAASTPARVRVTVQDGASPEAGPMLVHDVPAGPQPCLVALRFVADADTDAGELGFGVGGQRTAYSLTLDDVSLRPAG